MESMYKEAYCINYRVWLHLPLRRLINLHGVLGCRGLCLQLKRPVWPTRSSWLHFWTASRVQASTIKGSEYITLKHWLWKELFWIGQGAALMRWAKWLPLCSGCLWQSWWVWVKAGGRQDSPNLCTLGQKSTHWTRIFKSHFLKWMTL